jgi:hypothetical protein
MNRRYVKSRHLSAPRGTAAVRPGLLLSTFAVVSILSVVGYLVQVSSTSAKDSEIRHLDSQVASLKDECDRAELHLAQASATAAVETKIQTLGMVPADHIEYLTPSSVALARK